MKLKHAKLNKIIIILLETGVLALFLMFTNPNKVALPFLIVPFLLMGLIVYQIAQLVISLFVTSPTSVTSRLIPVSIAFVLLVISLLESLHQLTWKDSLLVIAFTMLFWIYLARADFLK